jgi:hypothetical protein
VGKRIDHAKAAANAMASLNAFHGIMAFLEARMLTSDHASEERRIIKICREGAAKALRIYDRHILALSATTAQGEG